jgi:hypothetical protein
MKMTLRHLSQNARGLGWPQANDAECREHPLPKEVKAQVHCVLHPGRQKWLIDFKVHRGALFVSIVHCQNFLTQIWFAAFQSQPGRSGSESSKSSDLEATVGRGKVTVSEATEHPAPGGPGRGTRHQVRFIFIH